MLKRLWIALAAALLFILCIAGACHTLHPASGPGPIISGKPESYWVDGLCNGNWKKPEWQNLGTNTVAVLAAALERREPALKSAYISVWPKLPGVVRDCLGSKPQDTALMGRMVAAAELMKMGKDAQPAIPALIDVSHKEHNDLLRSLAVICLGSCQSSDPAAIAALNNASLHDGSPEVRRAAALSLRRLGQKAPVEIEVK